MGIETKIKSLGVAQTKILEFSFSTGSQSQFFFWQHREYHSWESTEENDTTHGGSWGGGVHGAYGLLGGNDRGLGISHTTAGRCFAVSHPVYVCHTSFMAQTCCYLLY